MPICAKGVQQPTGDIVLVLDPSAANLSTCPYVVQSGAEVANSLFSLTAADGGFLSASIIGCWVAAYCVRVVINVIKGSTE